MGKNYYVYADPANWRKDFVGTPYQYQQLSAAPFVAIIWPGATWNPPKHRNQFGVRAGGVFLNEGVEP